MQYAKKVPYGEYPSKASVGEGWQTGQHYLALQFGCECELRPDCNKAVPVEKLCFLPIELALLRNDKN
jgi:hypothetical protein